MTQTSLVLICKSYEEIQKSIVNIPRNRSFTRFFIYVCDDKVDSAKGLTTNKDRFLSMPGVSNDAIIRAGILYSIEGIIIFINADNLPSVDDIQNSIVEIIRNGYISNEYIIGATKAWIVLNGFGIFQDQDNGVSADDSKIGMALIGQAVNKNILLRAIREVISDENFSIDITAKNDKFHDLWLELSHYMKSIDDELPNTIAISANAKINDMHNAINKIGDNGSIIMAATDEQSEWWQRHTKPIYILKCTDGFQVLIFDKNTTIVKNQYL